MEVKRLIYAHIIVLFLIYLDFGVKYESNLWPQTQYCRHFFPCLAYHHETSQKTITTHQNQSSAFNHADAYDNLMNDCCIAMRIEARLCFLNTARCWLALPLWGRLSIGCQRRGWLLLITNVVTGYDQGPCWHSLCKGQCMAKPTMKKWALCHHCQGKRSDTSWLVIELSN